MKIEIKDLPEKLRVIRDEAFDERQRKLSVEDQRHPDWIHVGDWRHNAEFGFNKCYEVMAEEHRKKLIKIACEFSNLEMDKLKGDHIISGLKATLKGNLNTVHGITKLQQQLAEKDALLSECREALEIIKPEEWDMNCISFESQAMFIRLQKKALKKLNQSEGDK